MYAILSKSTFNRDFCFIGCLRLKNLQVANIIGSGVELLYALSYYHTGITFLF